MSLILSAIVMGLAGSFHCVAMCSPLMMAASAKSPFLYSKIVYNIGRVLVYALLGAMAATIGSNSINVTQQNYLSVGMGIIFLLLAIGFFKKVSIPFLSTSILWLISKLKKWFGRWLTSRSNMAMFILGMLNGLLPCGLTYIAVASCFILPTALDGFLFMILFGLGTWPVMVGLTWVATALLRKVNYQRITAAMFLVTGILLIGRVFWLQVHPVEVVAQGSFIECTP